MYAYDGILLSKIWKKHDITLYTAIENLLVYMKNAQRQKYSV